MKINNFYLLIALFLAGCSTTQDGGSIKLPSHQDPDPKVYYKRDMKIKYDKKEYIGTVVLPKGDSYDLNFKSKGKLDLFTFTTCHREITNEHAGTTGFFESKKQIGLKYTPSPKHEKKGACPIQVAGYDLKGKHSFAYLDIDTDGYTLSATIHCNGQQYRSNGVTICQSKFGLEQSITFDVEVDFMPSANPYKNCKNLIYKTVNYKEFIYEIPARECGFVFIEKTSTKKHKLNTIGYEKILIREL